MRCAPKHRNMPHGACHQNPPRQHGAGEISDNEMTNMKKTFILCLCLLTGIGASSKSMTEIWRAIPDSLIPYIDAKNRTQMVDMAKMGLKGETDNALQGKSVMDTLTANYIHLTLNESAVIEMKMLPWQDGDSIVCVVKTWKTPQAQSTVEFYNQEWEPIALPNAQGRLSMATWSNLPFTRPDSMSEEEFKEMVEKFDFILTQVRLSADNNSMTISREAPLTPADEKNKVKSVLTDITLNWNGKRFE